MPSEDSIRCTRPGEMAFATVQEAVRTQTPTETNASERLAPRLMDEISRSHSAPQATKQSFGNDQWSCPTPRLTRSRPKCVLYMKTNRGRK